MSIQWDAPAPRSHPEFDGAVGMMRSYQHTLKERPLTPIEDAHYRYVRRCVCDLGILGFVQEWTETEYQRERLALDTP